jgi:hypothetical protein
MNGDTLEIMKVIGEKHDLEMKAIGDLSAAFSEHKGNIVARVESLEQDEKRNWWVAQAERWLPAVGIVGGYHGLRHFLGLK